MQVNECREVRKALGVVVTLDDRLAKVIGEAFPAPTKVVVVHYKPAIDLKAMALVGNVANK